MRYGILADVHGNLAAFSAIVAAMEKCGVERWVNLGDLAGYGPDPAGCIALARRLDAVHIQGNHDHALLAPDSETAREMRSDARETLAWSRTQLTASDLDFLAGMPRLVREGDFTFAHAGFDDSDPDYWPYVLDRKSALFHFYLQETPLGCLGHGHIPLAFSKTAAGLDMQLLHEVQWLPGPGHAFLWCPGSVGQSRDGDWRASGLFYDTATGAGHIVRAEYDVAATQTAIRSLGWPEALASRLR